MLVTKTYSKPVKSIQSSEPERPNLGNQIHLATYRMLHSSMRSALNGHFGARKVKLLLHEAGEIAGKELCLNLLDTRQDFYHFLSQLQHTLIELKIGILRIEKSDLEMLKFQFVIAEDLDNPKYPGPDFTYCDYEEGFITGIMTAYTNKEFTVKKVDCWTTGNRVCRYEVTVRP